MFSSDDRIAFTLNEDVNFADPDNETVVAAVNSDNGNITSYAIKAVGEVISGQRYEEKVIVGDFQKFLRVKLAGSNISEILSVEDELGNEYYEVDYLSQDVVYRDLINNGANKKTTPNVLRPLAVPRRFTSELMEGETYLQFGFGSEKDVTADPLLDPSKTILKVHGKDYFSDASFDPSNLVSTDKFGVAPSNTTLTIGYLANTLSEVNIAAGGLSNVVGPLFEFGNINTLVNSKVSDVINSLEVNNQEPITGDVTYPSIDELKERIYNVFASQNRAVTALDYKSMCYAMPTKYGAIKRANVIKDPGSLKRNLNIYVLSEDVDGNFTTANSTLKENLKHWLNQGRMINDTVDILDAKVINIGIEFDAI